MKEKFYYNKDINNDVTIPDSKRFQTAITLPKGTFKEIDFIQKNYIPGTRPQIIETAISYLLKYLQSDEYLNELKNKRGVDI